MADPRSSEDPAAEAVLDEFWTLIDENEPALMGHHPSAADVIWQIASEREAAVGRVGQLEALVRLLAGRQECGEPYVRRNVFVSGGWMLTDYEGTRPLIEADRAMHSALMDTLAAVEMLEKGTDT